MDEIDQVPSPWKTLGVFARRAAVGVVIAAGVWGAWYGYAEWRLNQKLAEYRARGEFASVEDLNDPPGDANDDAFVWLEKAAGELKLTAEEKELADPEWVMPGMERPLTEKEMAVGRGMVERHRDVLEYVERARRAKTASAPGVDILKFPNILHLPLLSEERHLSRFLMATALFNHQSHRDGDALKAVEGIETIARLAGRSPFLISHLVSGSCEAMSSTVVQRIAPTLELASASAGDGASRGQVQTVIRVFFDEQLLQEQLRRSLRTERIYEMTYAEKNVPGAIVMRPAALLDAVRSMQNQDATIHALMPGVPMFPRVKAKLPVVRSAESNLDEMAFPYSTFGDPREQYLLMHYRCLMDREAAASLLALRLYALDHGGAPAPAWAGLIPNYLPAAPEDLFRSGGGPLVYEPRRKVFYSVGFDGKDDGGIVTAATLWRHWHEPDAVFFMEPPPPPSPPPPETESSGVIPEPASAPAP